tara:strand:+ start:6120 stop:6521 length:402 start_codon:yes stop_codon:yes gene_type:complete
MANSTAVAALANGIQEKNVYRGNAQIIPIEIASVTADTAMVFSEVLPQTATLVAVVLSTGAIGSSRQLDLGTTSGGTDIVANLALTASTAANVHLTPLTDVGGKQIFGSTSGTTWTSDATYSLKGFAIIVTNE